MPDSEVTICNRGLLLGGAKPKITSLTEDSENGRFCAEFYESTRDAMLRSHPWNCAVERRTITVSPTAPDSDYDYQYQLPANPWCLRVLQVGEKDDDPGIEWRVEGRKILCDEGTSIKIVYIKRITDTNEFDPLLADAIALKLGSKAAVIVGSNPSLKKELLEELELIALPEARTIDGQESSGDTLETTTWERARR